MNVVVWSKRDCSFCEQAKNMLRAKNIMFEERKIGDGYSVEELIKEIPGAKTVPQIIIDGSPVGGFKELKAFFESKSNVNS